jgi:hypothetical protein
MKKHKTIKIQKKGYIGSGRFDTPKTHSSDHTGTPYDRRCKHGADCLLKFIPDHAKKFSHPPPCRDSVHCPHIFHPKHSEKFSHPSYTKYINDHQIKRFIKGCYYAYLVMKDPNPDKSDILTQYEYKIRQYCDNSDQFIKTLKNNPARVSMFMSQFDNGDISLLGYNVDDPDHREETFIYNLFAYISCNICSLVKNERDRDFISLMLFQFNELAVDRAFNVDANPVLKACIDNLGIPVMNAVSIASVLTTTNICKDNPEYDDTKPNSFYT